MNSRPPPCEGDALPAELLPHMGAATWRSVVCMPFMCRGQVFFAGGTSGGRGHGRRDGKSRTAAGPGASRGKAAACPPASGRSGEARRLPEKGEEAPGTRQGAARATCRARDARRFPRSALLADAGRIHAGAPAKRQCRARASRQATSARARAPGGLPGIAFLRPCAAKKSAGPPLWGLATAKKNAIEARWCHYEGISGSLFSQGQARELSGPFRVQAQGTGREVQALPPGDARSGSGRGSGLVVAGRRRKGGPARARAGLRHPDHGDRLPAAGHLHAGGRVQPLRCL